MDENRQEQQSPSGNHHIVAVAGSKGGVGVSMVAADLGIFLSQIGKNVVLIDANFNDSGLYAWLGSDRPDKNITDVLSGKVSLKDALTRTDIAGLRFLSGAIDLLGSRFITQGHIMLLIKQIKNLDTDFVIIDLPGGMDPVSVSLFCESDIQLLVSIATPDAVEATYRFMSSAWIYTFSDKINGDEEALAIVNQLKNSSKWYTPREIINILKETNSSASEKAFELSCIFRPQLLINQVKIKDDEKLINAMKSASTRWIGINPAVLGNIGWDDNVWLSQRRGKPLLIDFSRSRACKDMEQIVRKMLSTKYKDLSSPISLPPDIEQQNYYEILEIYPGASEEEVRRAYKQIKNWFGPGAMAVKGICTEEELASFQNLAEKAHAVLVDRFERRQYDRKEFPEGFSSYLEKSSSRRESIAGVVATTHESLSEVKIRDDQFVDGLFLGKIRKERNVELVDISNRAKVSVSYLKAIEEELFEELPAPVFARGFVKEFARFLKIDPKRAVTDFMAKYDAYFEQKKKK
jgi:flagellar biosynthesis protein FlhG